MTLKLPPILSFDKYKARSDWRRDHGENGFRGYMVRGKPKIHGVSMAISMRGDGQGGLLIRSDLRKGGDPDDLVTPGFQAVRAEIEATFRAGIHPATGETGILAEWAGPGVQRKDAVTRIDRPRLFVFAAWHLPEGEALELADRQRAGDADVSSRDVWKRTSLITSPGALARLISPSDNIEIVPWATGSVSSEGLSDESFERAADWANSYVDACAKRDPYIHARFGVSGPGEGLVAMPVSRNFRDASMETFAELSWKAKTDAHAVKKVSRPATTRIEMPEGISGLILDFVTPARIEQILSQTFPGVIPERAGTGEFIAAMVDDVLKESVEERAALGAEDRLVQSELRKAARQAYLKACDREASATPDI